MNTESKVLIDQQAHTKQEGGIPYLIHEIETIKNLSRDIRYRDLSASEAMVAFTVDAYKLSIFTSEFQNDLEGYLMKWTSIPEKQKTLLSVLNCYGSMMKSVIHAIDVYAANNDEHSYALNNEQFVCLKALRYQLHFFAQTITQDMVLERLPRQAMFYVRVFKEYVCALAATSDILFERLFMGAYTQSYTSANEQAVHCRELAS